MTPAIPGDNLTESPLLLAGEIAGWRGWVDAAVALPGHLLRDPAWADVPGRNPVTEAPPWNG